MSALTVEKSKLFQDISDVIKPHKEHYNEAFTFEVILHTVEKDLDVIDGVVLNTIHITRDYVNNISDYIEIQLIIPVGNYVYDVQPHLQNLEITVKTHKQKYKGKSPHIVTERYKAVFIDNKNQAAPNMINQSRGDLNQQMPMTFTFQILDRSVETIRVKTTQGNYDKKTNSPNSDMKIKSFLKSIFCEEFNKILIENKPPIDLINIEEPDNKDQLKAITIPSYTRIIELPEYIQNKNIGIYNGGVGCYIQKFGLDYYDHKKVFFLYSLYYAKKFDKSDYKLIFYIPPTSNHSVTKQTYLYKDKILKILPHYTDQIKDKKESQVMSTGSGFRMSNANSYMKKPIEMKADGPIFKRERLNTEITFKDRKDNLNFAPNQEISNNTFKHTAKILEKMGSYLTLEITNMDHDFIYPGAPCKIMFENSNNDVEEIYGVIQKAIITYTSTSLNMPISMNSKKSVLMSHITLSIFFTFGEGTDNAKKT